MNLIEDVGFEFGSTAWSGSSAGSFVTSDSRSGSRSFRISGDPETVKEISQTFPVSGDENATYILSGWSRANAVY